MNLKSIIKEVIDETPKIQGDMLLLQKLIKNQIVDTDNWSKLELKVKTGAQALGDQGNGYMELVPEEIVFVFDYGGKFQGVYCYKD